MKEIFGDFRCIVTAARMIRLLRLLRTALTVATIVFTVAETARAYNRMRAGD